MSETQYTPGPWVAIAPSSRHIYNDSDITTYHVLTEKTRAELIDGGRTHYQEDPYRVDNVQVCGMTFVGDMTLDEARANAHLIAAAPDLYAALEKIVESFQAQNYLRNDHMEIALDALFKARGES